MRCPALLVSYRPLLAQITSVFNQADGAVESVSAREATYNQCCSGTAGGDTLGNLEA